MISPMTVRMGRRVALLPALTIGFLTLIGSLPAVGQAPPTPAQAATAVRPDYRLGVNDQILIRVPGVAEINDQPFRVNAEGFIELPIVGRVQAAGQSVQNLEKELMNRLREFVREPQVYISLVQFRSEPVFFVGNFRTPGLYPLQGSRTLIEMLSSVGGIQPNASRRIRVTRRSEYGPIPLPNVIENAEKKISTADISLESLTQNVNPEEDIVLQPFDIVSAEAAERVYVMGEVTKSASLELGQRTSLSLAQALTEAGGVTPYANTSSVRVLRQITGTNRRAEIRIDLRDVLEGKRGDFPLLPNDVLYVPRSGVRTLTASLIPGLVGSIPYMIVSALVR